MQQQDEAGGERVCVYPVWLQGWYSDTQSADPDTATGVPTGWGSLWGAWPCAGLSPCTSQAWRRKRYTCTAHALHIKWLVQRQLKEMYDSVSIKTIPGLPFRVSSNDLKANQQAIKMYLYKLHNRFWQDAHKRRAGETRLRQTNRPQVWEHFPSFF